MTVWRRCPLVLAAVLPLLPLVLPATPAAAAPPPAPRVLVPAQAGEGDGQPSISRIAGRDRYETAAAIARATRATAVTAIVVAGDRFADALAASALAGALDAPILLTARDTLPSTTIEALAGLRVANVVIVGGAAAVSPAVEAILARSYSVDRIAGADRYATARDVRLAMPAPTGEIEGRRTAIVASGRDAADALAAGPLAAARRLPIVLTASDDLPTSASDALDDLDHVVVVGGTASVSGAVVDTIRRRGLSVERIAGADRYETAALVADFAITRLSFTDRSVAIADGRSFADALAGAALTGAAAMPMLLVAPAAGAASAFVRRQPVDDVVVLGGPGAVSSCVVDALWGPLCEIVPQRGSPERFAGLEDGGFAEFDGTNATRGTLTNVTTRAYEGRHAARATYDGSTQNGFARGYFHDLGWGEGTDVWYGVALFLPRGFASKNRGVVDLVRWDNWTVDPLHTDHGGLTVWGDGKVRLIREQLGLQPYEVLLPPVQLPEDRWVWLEVHQRLSAVDGSARNELWIDGRLAGANAEANSYGRPIPTLRYGIVAIAAGKQSAPLTLWFDRATISSEQLGP